MEEFNAVNTWWRVMLLINISRERLPEFDLHVSCESLCNFISAVADKFVPSLHYVVLRTIKVKFTQKVSVVGGKRSRLESQTKHGSVQ